MKITFQYDKEKDVWCLLNRGKSGSNSYSMRATKVYLQLVEKYGENPTNELAQIFIEEYISDNAIDMKRVLFEYQKGWDSVADEYKNRAEKLFGVSLSQDITGYLTVNNRCPYNIEGNYFFVSVPTPSSVRTTMHELWHFYTWRKFGADEEQKLGKEKYHEIKEALTVLLNVECKDLLPEGVADTGYDQHKDLRAKILEYWGKDRNLSNLWDYLVK